jgi:hypothetical protein
MLTYPSLCLSLPLSSIESSQDDCSEYSEDFETSHLNMSTSFKKVPNLPKKVESKPTVFVKSPPKISEEPVLAASAPIIGKPDDIISPADLLKSLFSQNKTSTVFSREVSTDPFADSIAKSFLASQVSLV